MIGTTNTASYPKLSYLENQLCMRLSLKTYRIPPRKGDTAADRNTDKTMKLAPNAALFGPELSEMRAKPPTPTAALDIPCKALAETNITGNLSNSMNRTKLKIIIESPVNSSGFRPWNRSDAYPKIATGSIRHQTSSSTYERK